MTAPEFEKADLKYNDLFDPTIHPESFRPIGEPVLLANVKPREGGKHPAPRLSTNGLRWCPCCPRFVGRGVFCKRHREQREDRRNDKTNRLRRMGFTNKTYQGLLDIEAEIAALDRSVLDALAVTAKWDEVKWSKEIPEWLDKLERSAKEVHHLFVTHVEPIIAALKADDIVPDAELGAEVEDEAI